MNSSEDGTVSALREVGHDHHRALEHADEEHLAASVILRRSAPRGSATRAAIVSGGHQHLVDVGMRPVAPSAAANAAVIGPG